MCVMCRCVKSLNYNLTNFFGGVVEFDVDVKNLGEGDYNTPN